MKKLIALTVVLMAAFGLTVAFAGPQPMEKNVAPVQPAPACDWTGFYIGVNVGITEFKSNFTDLTDWDSSYSGTLSYQEPAFIGGGQVGYNYQWQNLVLGVEADLSGSTAENDVRTHPGDNDNEDEGYSDYAKVDFMATFRGRIGIAF